MAAAAIALAAGDGIAQERGAGSGPKPQPEGKAKRPDRKKTRAKKKPKEPRAKADPAPSEPVAPTKAVGKGDVEFVVKTLPRGATITVDGTRLGESPLRVRARRGRRVIAATLRGHVDANTTVEIEDGLGYLVFSLAPTPRAAEVSVARPDAPTSKPKRSGFGTAEMKHGEAMQKARFALKDSDYAAALRYAEAAMASRPDDQEARMIATIAACGAGDAARAKRSLPARRGSYREVSIKRCGGLGVSLP